MDKAPVVTFELLEQMLKEIFERNEKLHEELHELLEKLGAGKATKNMNDPVPGWQKSEEAMIRLLHEMQAVTGGHLTPINVSFACGSSIR